MFKIKDINRMNWQEYREWIINNIFAKDESDSYRITYKLSDDAKKTYKTSNEAELTEILNNIVLSIEHEGWNLYYSLPIYQKRKTWQELFPDRLNVFFGAKPENNHRYYSDFNDESDNENEEENKTEISQENWDILTNIYADFKEWLKWEGILLDVEEVRNLLTRQGRERKGEISKNFTEETFLKSETCQDFIHRAETWLEEFRNLADLEQKDRLESRKEMVRDVLCMLYDRRNVTNYSSNNWPLARIARWGLAMVFLILVVISVVNWIKSLLKK